VLKVRLANEARRACKAYRVRKARQEVQVVHEVNRVYLDLRER
jgi:hypothetical protein